MSYQADDFEAIRRRQEEIAAECNLALTGSTLEETKKLGETAVGWPSLLLAPLAEDELRAGTQIVNK